MIPLRGLKLISFREYALLTVVSQTDSSSQLVHLVTEDSCVLLADKKLLSTSEWRTIYLFIYLFMVDALSRLLPVFDITENTKVS